MVDSTEHAILVDDARDVSLPADSIDLVVTSPPYPMIEMWDEVFSALSPDVEDALTNGRGMDAFELMHQTLDQVWERLADAVVDGGFVCINIGDATRTIDGDFQAFPNTARIIETFRDLGFHVLPRIYWQKPTNSPTSFMGSGTLPPNAYPKLEHEHILIFRNGSAKEFEPRDAVRYESAYFYEERNKWFSDHWTDVHGVQQAFEDATDSPAGPGADQEQSEHRDRTAAFPIVLPYRLINMFSVYGDVVYDPFAGTGTTTVAAMLTGRHSVGVEIDSAVAGVLDERVQQVPASSQAVINDRIERHQAYLQERAAAGNPASYQAHQYPFDVVTQQEQDIQFYEVTDVEAGIDQRAVPCVTTDESVVYTALYKPYSRGVPVRLSRYAESESPGS